MIEIGSKHIIVVCKYKNRENQSHIPTMLRDKALEAVLHGKYRTECQTFYLARLL